MAGLTCYQILLAVGMLITGSINTISKKAQNDISAAGYFNHSTPNNTATVHKFDHPWFQTIIMFLGEILCLFGLLIHRRRERSQYRKEVAECLEEGTQVPDPPNHPRIVQLIICFPTICDLVGTSLAGVGLVYVNASVWQMLRGSIIVFTGILSKIFLKRKLRGIHWLGMLIVMIGLVLVGLSSVLKGGGSKDGDGGKAVLGIIFILAGQVVSSVQMIVEELFIKSRGYHPLQVVGMEGSYGFLIMAIVVLPAMYFIPGPQLNNSYENSLDALYQIKNNPMLLCFCLLYLSSIAFYNYFGLAVTRSLTAVHRTLIDACRTMLVWIVDLFIYYVITREFGEQFDKTYGLLQIDGFLFLMIGTALYNEIIDVPCISCLRRQPRELQTIQRNTNIQEEEDRIPEVDERARLLNPATNESVYS